MNDSLLYKLSSGKPPKFIYFISNTLKMLIPNAFYRYKLKSTLAQLQYRSDKDYIEERVNYYNKLSSPSSLPEKSFIKNEFRYLIFLGTLADNKNLFFIPHIFLIPGNIPVGLNNLFGGDIARAMYISLRNSRLL